MKRTRIYADTSVIGGCFDDEFAEESRALLDAARGGRVLLLLSDLLAVELARAAPEIQRVLADLEPESFDRVSS